MKYRSLALIGTLSLMGLTPALAAQEAEAPAVVVQGEGRVEVEPDLAVVRIGVETQAATAQEAQAENNRIANRILDALRDLDIESESLQTARLALFPVYENRPPEQPGERRTVAGYRATNTVSVELDDLTRIGPVVDAGVGAGANRIEGIDFGVADEMEPQRQALAAAVESARTKAEAIADALGVALGAPLEITEHGVSMPRGGFMMRGETLMAQDGSTPVEPGRITVTAALSVRYRLGAPSP